MSRGVSSVVSCGEFHHWELNVPIRFSPYPGGYADDDDKGP